MEKIVSRKKGAELARSLYLEAIDLAESRGLSKDIAIETVTASDPKTPKLITQNSTCKITLQHFVRI